VIDFVRDNLFSSIHTSAVIGYRKSQPIWIDKLNELTASKVIRKEEEKGT
jgi:hypothetical protein